MRKTEKVTKNTAKSSLIEQLISTKMHIPPARPNLIIRTMLINQIHYGVSLGRGLTLVSAPAGYGKSVLVAEWLRSLKSIEDESLWESKDHFNCHQCEMFWLSLETNDNEPSRFLSYLAEAFQLDDFDVEMGIKSIVDWSDFSSVETLLTGLINCMVNDSDASVVLVLDDYHRIREPIIHHAIQFLLDHRPPHMHIVIITREDPPLALSRMRAQDALTELRARDLSFTVDEAAEFIKQTMRLEMKTEWVQTLTTRTEGWVAGLQLAALSLRQSKDIPSFLQDFKGSHRYLVDYLMDEVLRYQPEDIRLFLCQTSILKKFTPDLCMALTGRNDSRKLLNKIEKENLFLISLDDQREWYRYHHLFADCLRKELDVKKHRELCLKAAQWSEEHGLFADAVDYALATNDYDLAADTVEKILANPHAWSSGHLSMLEGWLKSLPESSINCRPDLQVMASRALFLAGKFEQGEKLLEKAEQILKTRSLGDENTKNANLLSQIGVYRASIATVHGRLAKARDMIQQAMINLPTDSIHLQARAFDTLAMIHEQAGNMDEAVQAYMKASEIALSAGVAYLAINSRCEVAMVRLTQGLLSEAEHACQEALTIADLQGKRIPPSGLAWAILGDIMRERNLLDSAERYIEKGIELSTEGGLTDDLQQAGLFLARLKIAQGERSSAISILKRSMLTLKSYKVPRLTDIALMLETRASLILGDLSVASYWAKDFESQFAKQPVEYLQERELVTLARVWLVEQRISDTHPLLEKVITSASDAGRNGTVLEALILLGIAGWRRNDRDVCFASMCRALSLGEHQGYIRLFVDEGEEMRQILTSSLEQHECAHFMQYGEKLLAAFNQGNQKNQADLLSSQESRILKLIAHGATNRDIAEELFISVGTVKWHLHNIYEKFDVSSRTQAIIKGRELKIL